jgi:BirA family biotin operon repressor/biotin-[acetyl-CoA-carboxylase] ligase
MSDPVSMPAPREEWSLPTRRLGRRVLVYDRVHSTNDLAALLTADPANDGTAVLAAEQIAGRGQHGRTWQAAPRSSVLLSLALSPPAPLCRPAILAAWAAVAVCATVYRTVTRQARIKWPNDVLVSGKKICGILIEQARGVVAGIGLNVQQTAADFTAAGLPDATSLRLLTEQALDTAAVARLLIEELDAGYDALLQGDLGTLEATWKWHVGLLGKETLAECSDGWHRGRLVEIGFNGIELRSPDGETLILPPEKVLHLYPAEGRIDGSDGEEKFKKP